MTTLSHCRRLKCRHHPPALHARHPPLPRRHPPLTLRPTPLTLHPLPTTLRLRPHPPLLRRRRQLRRRPKRHHPQPPPPQPQAPHHRPCRLLAHRRRRRLRRSANLPACSALAVWRPGMTRATRCMTLWTSSRTASSSCSHFSCPPLAASASMHCTTASPAYRMRSRSRCRYSSQRASTPSSCCDTCAHCRGAPTALAARTRRCRWSGCVCGCATSYRATSRTRRCMHAEPPTLDEVVLLLSSLIL
jgi:hypothetical protein